MKNIILPAFIIAALFTGCVTANRSTQTPDDLYYSPSSGKETVSKEQKQFENDLTNSDNQFLWMKVQNYYLWNTIDDYSYWYDPRFYSPMYSSSYYNCGCGFNYFSDYYPSWNVCIGGYSPIYASYKNPSLKINGTTAGSNITAYKNRTYNNSNNIFNLKGGNNPNNSFSQLVRKTFTPANSNNSGWSNPVRVSSYPSTSSGTAGGNSGGATSSGSSSSGGRGGRGGH